MPTKRCCVRTTRGDAHELRRPSARALPTSKTLPRCMDDLRNVIDIDAIRSGKLRLGCGPSVARSIAHWSRIAERYGLDIPVEILRSIRRFSFMTVDHDGKI